MRVHKLRPIDYRCNECGREFEKRDLRAKRIQFLHLGLDGKILKTRTVAWLCIECMEADLDYQRPAHDAAPGMSHTKRAIQREAQ